MILQTGRPSDNAARLPAFTLVEFLLVMSLLIVVFALAAPSLANFFRGRTLDSEARRLLALTRYGQSRAVAEGVPMMLWLDANARTYGLEEQAGYSDQDVRALEFTLDKDLQLEVGSPLLNLNTNSTVNQSASASANAYFNANATPVNPNHRNLPAIRFLPDGFIGDSSPPTVQLLDREGAALLLTQTTNRLNYEIRLPTNQWDTVTP